MPTVAGKTSPQVSSKNHAATRSVGGAMEYQNEIITGIMRTWASWRRVNIKGELGYGPTITARMLGGMKSTRCPDYPNGCGGEGSVVLVRNGRSDRVMCPVCQGSCRISARSREAQINPAFIRSTKHGDADDPQSERVDKLVCALPHLQLAVIMQEYCRNGRRDDKCRRITMEFGSRLGRERYEQALEAAHTSVWAGLGIGGQAKKVGQKSD